MLSVTRTRRKLNEDDRKKRELKMYQVSKKDVYVQVIGWMHSFFQKKNLNNFLQSKGKKMEPIISTKTSFSDTFSILSIFFDSLH